MTFSGVLGYIILLPVMTAATVAGVALACYVAYGVLFEPVIDLPYRKPRKGFARVTGFLKDVTLILPNALKKKVKSFALEHANLLYRTHLSSAPALILLIDQVNGLATRTAGTLADMAEQTYRALWHLNNRTIPRKISAAVTPLRNQLERHTGRLDELEDLNRRVAVEIGDTLRALPWGVPGGYVTNFAAFLGRFVQLWEHYWNVTRAQLNTLLDETIPELRSDVAALARRLDVGIDARLDALAARLNQLETWREGVVMPRLQNAEDAIGALAREVFGEVGTGLTALIARVAELEAQLETVIPQRLAELRDDLDALRLELQQGIATGLEAFEGRIEALELETFTNIPQRLDALALAIDTLAREAFAEVGAGLAALTERIVEIERQIGTIIPAQIDLLTARLTEIETNIRDNVLPRLAAIEQALTPAALAVAVLAALRIAAPNLFCRNVSRATEALCADDEAFWRDLLGGLLVFAIALNPREVAQAGAALTGILGGVIAETVDH